MAFINCVQGPVVIRTEQMTGDAFSLVKVSKHDFGEDIVPYTATFCLPLTAAARLVEHTDHEFNPSWLIAEASQSSFSFSSG